MKRFSLFSLVLAFFITTCFAFGERRTMAEEVKPDRQSQREAAAKLFQDGNFNDALSVFRKMALEPENGKKTAGDDLTAALICLERLNRVDETDELRNEFVTIHKQDWRAVQAAAETFFGRNVSLSPAKGQAFTVQSSGANNGFIIAGKFQRGQHRGGGNFVNCAERDRVQALQLMNEALPLAQKDENRKDTAEFLLALSNMIENHRNGVESWRLQYLTDLKTLPDYEPGWGGYYGQASGAPVDEKGNPVFYIVPKSFEAAESDGQRWRWCLQQAIENDLSLRSMVLNQFAAAMMNQFGTQTLSQYGWDFGRGDADDKEDSAAGIFAMHTLGDDETIARLATGVKRFKLPDEFNFIKIYQGMAADPKQDNAQFSASQLVGIYENRRQFEKAADWLRWLLKNYSSAHQSVRKGWQSHLDQIVGAWGRFENSRSQPSGKGATVEYRYRNGTEVEFTAHAIKVDLLLSDIKNYLKIRPRSVQWDKTQIGDVGWRLVNENRERYVGEQVANWKLPLKPKENHFDARVTVTTPLSKPGAYLLNAKMKDGNETWVIVWVDDTAIVKKPLDGKTLYYVADAVTGKPISKANVEYFGWRAKYSNGVPQPIEIKQFAEFSNESGQIILSREQAPQEYQWLVIARTPEGRLAYLGFSNMWYGNIYDQEYNQTKVYSITDRPVYRPDQTVKYKFWVAQAKYDVTDGSAFANQSFTIELYNPKGEKIVTEEKTADAYGGIEGEYKLPTDATLGVYRFNVVNHGGGTFRVEEYKKPEYEVTIDAPKAPVMLGETITATIKAKYYFGSPVTKAKVKFKVQRTASDERWYPTGIWDWFYGPGYWWFCYDYAWYPGWHEWGCLRPYPLWFGRGSAPPELVMDREVEIGADGTVKVEIDTAAAKALHADQDHRYSITAEVIDESRRTITGEGTVLVARKPFSVYTWVDRGYYRVGDVIHAGFSAQTLDHKPIEGKGELRLLQISYKDDGKPTETVVQTWALETNAEGTAKQQMTASQAGQYRLSYKVTDAKGHAIEGGYLFTVIGEGFNSAQFRFNQLELVPDKREYAPGEKVNLQINTDRPGSVVLLFVRPTNGICLPPKVLRLEGKSAIEEIAVVQKDMPNFFIEALTVADGKVYTECKEIVVPPEKRVLSVEVIPSSESYKPGEKAKVKLKLTDFFGQPFVGSTVVSIYDKSVEYISGGSNVPEIKEFFWKWRRYHSPNTESSLERYFSCVVKKDATAMQDLGAFGRQVFVASGVDNLELAVGGRAGNGPIRSRMMAKSMAARAPAAAMEVAAAPMQAVEQSFKEKSSLGDANFDLPANTPVTEPSPLVQPTVRSKFADTALWVGSLTTDKNGEAEVALDMPENLTTWRIKVWAMGGGTKVGQGQADVVTRKDLIVRLQAPRFFVQTDEVVLSAVVHNYLKTRKQITVQLELGENKLLEIITTPSFTDNGIKKKPDTPFSKSQIVEIEPNGEARVDWRVEVQDEGEAVVRMKALTDEDSDAMEQKFPCYVHGMLKTDSFSGSLRPEKESGQITVQIPEKRRPKQSLIEVRYSPTLAGAMVDALPYLVDYPYGCTEQTLNKFLPAVITQKTLIDMKLNLKDIRDKRTNLNAQEIGDAADRAKQWKRFDRNPVFDEAEVLTIVKTGVARLTEMQLSDGGWGWFSGFGEYSSPHTTATVVHGLQVAQQYGAAVVPEVLQRGVEWLKRYQDEQITLLQNAAIKDKSPNLRWKESADNIDSLVYMVLADADLKTEAMRDFLYRDRTKLAVYSMATFGLALEKQGEKEKLDMLLRNINQYVEKDDENQTAWLKLADGYWWYWYGSENEANAYYLKLLAKTDPKGELAPRFVKYLLNNRKNATYWNSTRDTALCIEAFAEFLRASGESTPNMTVEVYYDGKLQKSVEVTPATLFTFDNQFVVAGDAVTPGKHTIELKKKGQGPLYYNAYSTNFTLEDFITKAGLEIKVERKYYKLVKADKSAKVAGAHGQAIDQKVEKYERVELPNGAELKSGDLVEVELKIDSKNDYEYLIFEDMKPSGFEPVEVRSGYNGNDLHAYVEFRDNRVVFFTRQLARGTHSVSYRMRAETPGRFSALPTRAAAMYAPELRGNSDEQKIGVSD